MRDITSQLDESTSDYPEDYSRGMDASQLNHPLPDLFDSFPNEIVSNIFIQYVHGWNPMMWPMTPLTLGKICQKWRQTAWSTPNLWTTLTISSSHALSETHFELAREWLDRSGTLPLTINLYLAFEPMYGPDVASYHLLLFGKMFEVLKQFSDRWYIVCLSVPSCLLTQDKPSLRSSSILHRLTVSFNSDHEYPDSRKISSFLAFSPKVVKIPSLQVEINWTSVTELELNFGDVGEVLDILQLATNLSKCHVFCRCKQDIRIRLPSLCPVLEYLHIEFGDEMSQQLFCDTVSMPALQHLGFVGYDDILSVDDLTSFYIRSSCALQCLAIDEADFEQGDLADFIPLLSSLRELRLRFRTSGSQRHKYPDRSHIKQFPSVPISLASCHGEPLLPLLEVFCWEGRAAYPWGTIPGLITPICRQSGQHRRPLKSIKIKCYYGDRYPFIEEGVVQQLLAISDVKLDLTVSTGRFEGGYHAVDWLTASVERPAEDPTFKLRRPILNDNHEDEDDDEEGEEDDDEEGEEDDMEGEDDTEEESSSEDEGNNLDPTEEDILSLRPGKRARLA